MKFLKIFIFIAYFLGLSTTAYGDEVLPSYMEIKELTENSYSVILKVPSKKNKLNVEILFSPAVDLLSEPKETNIDRFFVHSQYIYAKEGLGGTTIRLKGLERINTEVLLRIIDKTGNSISGRISPNSPYYEVQKTIGKFDAIKTYGVFGFEHILAGMDHLLFVVCLVFLSTSYGKLFWAITGFTLAHSVTLVLSALQIVQLPIPPIEAGIALSIIFLAVEIAKRNSESLAYRYPVAVSSSFGLLHGFGFASALMEVGLPQTEQILALLFFNIGVEIGQLVFVAILVSALSLLGLIWKRSKYLLLTPASYVIGSIATMWLIQRITVF